MSLREPPREIELLAVRFAPRDNQHPMKPLTNLFHTLKKGLLVTARIMLITGIATLIAGCQTFAGPLSDGPAKDINKLNCSLKGHVYDFSFNHGKDNRIYSECLELKRDLYVYTPPKYDPKERYPLVIWMHGYSQDEKSFLEIIDKFDKAIAEGMFPKAVIAAPDGSPQGRASFFDPGTLFLNSPLGRFEDYVVYDVYNHVVKNFSIRPERESHILAGASMGGFAAFNLGFKHKDRFGVLIGIHPPLNLRYADCRGRTRTDFDPNCFSLTDRYRPFAPVAQFYGGLITIRQRRILAPVFGEEPNVVGRVALQNPYEMLDTYNIKPGDFSMFIGYGNEDEFNFDAHCESFLYKTRQMGIRVYSVKVIGGHHDRATALKMLPTLGEWITPVVGPYSPK